MDNDNKIKQFLKNNFIYFIIAFACIAYITYGLIRIEQSGKTILEIIGSGIVIFILGYLICELFSLQGMLTGDRKPEVIQTNNLHAKCVADVDPKINEMDSWCEIQNANALCSVRKQILNRAGLRYSDCFEQDGTAKDKTFEYKMISAEFQELRETNPDKYKIEKKKVKDYNKIQKLRAKSFRKAIKVKVTPLTTDAVTAITVDHNDPNNLGMDRRKYQELEAHSSLISKIIMGIVFSYFTFSFIFGWENIIAAIIQVAIFLLMGAIKFVQSYYFVTEDLRKRTVRQINFLQRFKCDKGIATREEVVRECSTLKDGATALKNIENQPTLNNGGETNE